MLPEFLGAGARLVARCLAGFFAVVAPSRPMLGARWVEVSRAAPSGDPPTFERAEGAAGATRDVALTAGVVHRVPHPLGRKPEGVLFTANTAGSPIAEGEHTASHLLVTARADTTVRAQVL
jgi:hypothetical protein